MHKHHHGKDKECCGAHTHSEQCQGHGKGHGHSHGKQSAHGHHTFTRMVAARARRGEVRAAILRLLSEQPMHGYQIIQELSARSGGIWNPSAGSVYPTLQLLVDSDLLTVSETEGKKVYSLTEAGSAEATKLADSPAPWDSASENGPGAATFHGAVGKMKLAIKKIMRSGSKEKIEAAIKVLDDASNKLAEIADKE